MVVSITAFGVGFKEYGVNISCKSRQFPLRLLLYKIYLSVTDHVIMNKWMLGKTENFPTCMYALPLSHIETLVFRAGLWTTDRFIDT